MDGPGNNWGRPGQPPRLKTGGITRSYVPPAPIEPVAWKPKQRGHVDIFVNVAVIAGTLAAAAIVTRDPLFVNQTWKKPFQFDQTTNLAIYAQGGTAQIRPLIEPQLTKQRWQQPDIYPNVAGRVVAQVSGLQPLMEPQLIRTRAAQPDILPNIAGRANEVTPVTRAPFFMAYKGRAWTQPEVVPNLAVNALSARITAALEAQRFNRKPPQSDSFPNLAISAVAQASRVTPALDLPTFKRIIQQPEVLPNLAVATNEVTPVTRAPTFMPYKVRAWTRPELTPNLSLGTVAVTSRVTVAIETQAFKRPVVQVDIAPNLAVNVVMTSFIISADDAINYRKWPQLDLTPNLAARAITASTYMPAYVPEQAIARKWLQTDLYPNLAAGAVIQAPRVPQPFDPWINKRCPPQIDLYPNLATNFVAEVARVVPLPIEPQLSLRYAPQIVEYPNLVISVPYSVPVVPDTSQRPAGRRKRYEVEIDGELFRVDSVQEAVELLAYAKKLAVDKAKAVANDVVSKRLEDKAPVGKPIRVPAPQVSTPDPALVSVVIEARHAIAKVYRNAALDAEIRLRMEQLQKEQDDNDEDDLLFLL